ncbi:hypothetical protein ACFQV2_29090 [Actinokineospora soli]|uniref:Uncharacterized protein n=1 Tax=Actinokineospora soli TaxID=1048753 RepID=A0ABW2TTU6_9PSEU
MRVGAAGAAQVLGEGGAQRPVPGGVGQAEVVVGDAVRGGADGVGPAAAREGAQVGQAGREVVPDGRAVRRRPRARGGAVVGVHATRVAEPTRAVR